MTTRPRTDSIDVLLVEDNPGDVRLTKEAFAETTVEMTFHTVTDGEQALSFLGQCESDSVPSPDLILLDLNLPRVDGFAVLEALKDELELPPIPVFVLTSSEASEDIRKSYQLAANAYLSKPNDPDEFASLVQAVEAFWIDTVHLPSVAV